MKQHKLSILVLLAALLLSACASQPTPAPNSELQRQLQWQILKQQLQGIDSWLIEGKLGVRTEKQAHSINLNWQQNGAGYRVHLSGPLGQGATELTGDTEGVSLSNNEGHWQAESPEALLQQKLGWYLPVSALNYWIRALPIPNVDMSLELDNEGQPRLIQQGPWKISYSRYQAISQSSPLHSARLPSKIKIENAQLKLTFIITQWTVL